MSKFNGKIVLITGGASGIGRIMGEMALKKGASALVIWDINQTNIDATIGELKAFGKVVGYRVDVSNYEVVAESYRKVKSEVGDVDILIGTQMLTKGFDFGGLTLVAVIAADTLLGVQDFRADEKAVQILEQFSGRCGRRDSKGLTVIQTSQPEHPVYKTLVSGGSSEYNGNLLMERKDFGFPPYTRIIETIVKDSNEKRGNAMAFALAGHLRSDFSITGPYSPAVDKVADQHIRIMRISLKKDRNLGQHKKNLMLAIRSFEKERKYDGHITINVDPA